MYGVRLPACLQNHFVGTWPSVGVYCVLCCILLLGGWGGGPSVVGQGSFIVYEEQCIWFVSLVACVWATEHVCMPLLITVRVSPPVSVILGKSHYVLYNLVAAMQPRMLVTFDEELRPLPVSVRVGQVRGFTFFCTPGQPCHPPAPPPPPPPPPHTHTHDKAAKASNVTF